MLTILSPSKTLKFIAPQFNVHGSIPLFLSQADAIAQIMKTLDVGEISDLMKVSVAIARLTFERFQQWNLSFNAINATPALFTFRGDVFEGLDANSLTLKEVLFSQDSLRILSGLYGVLRPLDLMQPYRLEMGLRFKFGQVDTLYAYWGDRLAKHMVKEVGTHGEAVVVNLASQEYYRSVASIDGKVRVVTPTFYETINGKARIVAIHAKRARGLMARFIIKEQIDNPEQLKLFEEEGYLFSPNASLANKWAFIR